MEKNELLKLARAIDTLEKLKKSENDLVDKIIIFVNRELKEIEDKDKVQDLVNKCVNSFAATFKNEIGLMDKEGSRILERVRMVSASTVSRDKNKNAPADSGKNENKKS